MRNLSRLRNATEFGWLFCEKKEISPEETNAERAYFDFFSKFAEKVLAGRVFFFARIDATN